LQTQLSLVILLTSMVERLKKRLGEILIEDGSLTQDNLDEALTHQKKEGGMIGQILIKLGYISEENLIAAIGKQLRIPYIPLSHYSINADAVRLISEEICRRNLILAFDVDDKRIFLALGDPLQEEAVEEISKRLKLKPQIFVSTPSEIYSMLDVLFSSQSKKDLKKAG
jgi:type IV pilus assembly protein PilB